MSKKIVFILVAMVFLGIAFYVFLVWGTLFEIVPGKVNTTKVCNYVLKNGEGADSYKEDDCIVSKGRQYLEGPYKDKQFYSVSFSPKHNPNELVRFPDACIYYVDLESKEITGPDCYS